MVGMTGFEPATPWSQIKCTTKLCYIPKYKFPMGTVFFNKMARPVGIEPATFWSVVKRSIQLSYGRVSCCSYQQHFVIITEFVLICNNFFYFFTAWFLGLVGMTGLEPVRCFHHRILSPMRLPIPPHPQFYGGTCQIWTGDHRVAVYCLTTWLRYHFAVLYYYIWTPIKMHG